MKKINFIFFIIASLAFTDRHVQAQTTTPCEGVTCSNHGTCIVKEGAPVCACEEGYIPDPTTGLSCQPAGEPKGPQGPSEAKTDKNDAEIIAILGNKGNTFHLNYMNSLAKRRGMSFTTYSYIKARRKRNGFIALAVVPTVVLQACALGGFAVGLNVYSHQSPAGIGVVAAMMAVSTAPLIAGSVLAARWAKRVKGISPYMQTGALGRRTDLRFEGIFPFMTPEGRLSGPSASFFF
jgi:hypothetical protein